MTFASRKMERLRQVGKLACGSTATRLYKNLRRHWLAVSQAETTQPFVLDRARVQAAREFNRYKRTSLANPPIRRQSSTPPRTQRNEA
jgi:hypothetical protein